jgi:hypothetical protein
MLRDMYSLTEPVVSLGAAVRSADANGTGVDLRGFGAATILLNIGVGGITFDATNKIEFVLQESDDDSTYTAVAATDVIVPSSVTVTSGIVRSLVAAHAAAAVYRVGYIGTKRYIRVAADFSGTHGTGTPIAATVLRQKPDLAPV